MNLMNGLTAHIDVVQMHVGGHGERRRGPEAVATAVPFGAVNGARDRETKDGVGYFVFK